MNRRGFLGSLLGLAASQSIFAKLLSDEPQQVILPYRMLFHETGSNLWVQAPGVKEVIKHSDGFEFIAEPLLAKSSFTFGGAVRLYTMDNQLLWTSSFKAAIPMCNGDTLHAKLKLITAHERDFANDKELVKYILDHPESMRRSRNESHC